MGAGASISVVTPYQSVKAALAAGKTQEEINIWLAENNINNRSETEQGGKTEQGGETKEETEKTKTSETPIFNFLSSHKGRLTRSNVFCRIRPFAADGGHAKTDEIQAKQLDSWDDSSVSVATQYMFSKGSNKYDFPRAVFPPEATQEQVFNSVAPPIIDALTEESGMNVVMFAYGQTGTGKTHTMFGPDGSLESGSFDERWGLFPRLVHAIFDKMKASANRFIITASAIEFYMTLASDLLANNAPILIDREHKPIGQTVLRFESISDLMPFLSKVRKHRTSRSTKMNSQTENHDGSSRSHAALILNIFQLNSSTKKYCKTRLTLMDLAGAERPDKPVKQTAKQKKEDELVTMISAIGGGSDIAADLNLRGKDISVFAQASLINFELTMLSNEVRKASENHRKKKKYSPPLQNCPDMIKFLGSCFKGDDLMSMMVALSPSGNNGWETWFSCQYGTDLSNLSAPVKSVKAKDIEKGLKAAENKKKEVDIKLKGNLKSNNKAAMKFRPLLQCQAKSTTDEVFYLKLLSEM
jgi:hypothetical protein